MLNISMNTIERRKVAKKTKLPLFRILILAFILTTISLTVLEGSYFWSAIKYVFLTKKYIVVYETYSIHLKDIGSFSKMFEDGLDDVVFDGKERFKFVEGKADITISTEQEEGSKLLFSKDFLPVGHFYSLKNSVSTSGLKDYSIYLLDGEFEEYLEREYGVNITVLESYDSLLQKLKDSDENIGLLDVSKLEPSVKLLSLDGKYFLDDGEGSLAFKFWSKSSKDVDDFILDVVKNRLSGDGLLFDDSKLVKLNMGGVVAISRGLASKMDGLKSTTYPADEIGEFLADADLTHVSNEVSFMPGCSVYSGMRFCSRPEYIDVLKKSGVDIVELTGNHNNDFGSKYNADSIKMYTDLGWRYFGGGLNGEDASKILYEEVKGSKIAFLGYNYYDTMLKTLALAGDGRAGANSYSEEKLGLDIEKARSNADVVIVDFQFQECYSYPNGDVIYPICYKPLSSPDQKGVFRKAIDLGADIVIGTQAHQPQTFELYNGGVIFYGLGNLYFDQSIWIGTRQGIVLSHYFVDGEHIQSRVTPIYMEKDLKVRLANEEQSDLLLKLLKNAR